MLPAVVLGPAGRDEDGLIPNVLHPQAPDLLFEAGEGVVAEVDEQEELLVALLQQVLADELQVHDAYRLVHVRLHDPQVLYLGYRILDEQFQVLYVIVDDRAQMPMPHR